MELIKEVRGLQMGGHNGDCPSPESCRNIYIYELDNSEEYFELVNMNHEELCEELGCYEDRGEIFPGAIYYNYDFVVKPDCLIIIERVAYNV